MIDKGKRWSSRTVVLTMATAAMLGGAPMAAEAAAAPATASQAADVTVRGTVVDATGEPIIGASVMIKGTSKGAATDLDGNFQIPGAPAKGVLTVSYIGCKPAEIKLDGRSDYEITLEEDNAMLEEVVVVGYGTQKKATLTGSVAVVGAEQLSNKGTLSSPVQALQGQVPGVIITRANSAPGDEGWDLKLRGSVSKNAAAPLIIIDGVEYESVNDLRLINPSDIESMNFLKDAAASIYGSKAAGGVVLVTTKKAKEGKVKVDYSGSYTFKHIGLRAKTMTLDQWANGVLEVLENDLDNPEGNVWYKYANLARRYHGSWIDGNPLGMNKVDDMVFFDTDWNDVMWGDSYSTNHELSVSGGSDKNVYRFSLGYMYDDSNLKWGNNHNQRVNLRLNNTMQLAPNFSLQSVIAYNRQDQVAPTEINAALKANQAQPGFPTSTISGKPYAWGEDWFAPNWLAELGGDNKLKVNAVNISETLRYEIIPGLSANAVLGYNHSGAVRDTKRLQVDFYNYNDTFEVSSPSKTDDTYYEKGSSYTDFYSVQGYLNWNKTFREIHDVTLMAGVQYNMKQYEWTRVKIQNNEPTLEVPKGSGTIDINKAEKWEEAIMSYYGRFNYAYKSKYMLEGQFRYDGSSKFQADNRWAFFWGASLGWRISQEKFLDWSRGFLDDLKLRASYGNVGNQAGIDRYSGVMLWKLESQGKNLIGGNLVSTLDTNGKLVSTDRTWERIHNYNVAVDFSLFNNRLSGTGEAFWKHTDNMLIDVVYPGILGDKAPTANKGKFKAWGYEGQITWRDRIGNVNYHIGGSFTYADNELVDNGGSGVKGGGIKSDREGYPLRSVWGLKYCGKIQTEEQLEKYKARYAETSTIGNISKLRLGDNMFEDVNKDGQLTAEDLVYLGTDDPKIQFSFNAGLEWRGFDINVIFQGAAKRTIFRCENDKNSLDIWQIPMRDLYMNGGSQWIGNVWSKENPNGRYPQLTSSSTGGADVNNYNYQCSSWSVNDGSYLRLKNLTIGYTIPQNVIKKTKVLSNVRFYATGTDLWEISHINDGWDPEGSSNMSGLNRYPFLRTWTVGANLTF
ncbi:TonB-dependent receptor [uncultured Muribaculum sp.]|uniref:SusC/RagA family TonB-linked outer membrane protein n=1 Tax=uncultured Muribaculum sp. TaxID=1918613 RepID=UPI0025EE0C31|nr:TonB-dependent receptor [uncultured Muribaculum sp.]